MEHYKLVDGWEGGPVIRQDFLLTEQTHCPVKDSNDEDMSPVSVSHTKGAAFRFFSVLPLSVLLVCLLLCVEEQ